MNELLVKLAEESSELAFAALKYRTKPTARNRLLLLDEIADVVGCIRATKLPLNRPRATDKARKYRKLKGSK